MCLYIGVDCYYIIEVKLYEYLGELVSKISYLVWGKWG